MPNALVEAVRKYTDAQAGESACATAIQGLYILRSERERPGSYVVLKPSLCVVVQGAKWTMFGDKRFHYRAGQALVVSVEMPAVGRVVAASPREPYLGIMLELDPMVMRDVLESLDAPPRANTELSHGVFVTDFEGPLADCVLRMVRLLATPQAIPLLQPAIMREICYWLLTGPHGTEVARMTLAHDHTHHVLRAIHTLRRRFAEAVWIDDLASAAHMSPSAFHRQFKAITSMTPLQYQKQLRLVEARRLMLSDGLNVETAAFNVGYESASQFSREYSRMFGKSPRRDVASLKGAPPVEQV